MPEDNAERSRWGMAGAERKPMEPSWSFCHSAWRTVGDNPPLYAASCRAYATLSARAVASMDPDPAIPVSAFPWRGASGPPDRRDMDPQEGTCDRTSFALSV
jgi:hypothetical protein